MVLKVAQLGQPVLRQVAKPVPITHIGTGEFQDFIDQMHETLDKHRGVGLAAPQVFDSRRVFLAAILPPFKKSGAGQVETFINPRIVQPSEEKEADWEGCLSFLELLVLVPRHTKLRLEYLNRDGDPKSLELAGYAARVVQHEYDHLDGVLTLDRALSTKDIIKASELDAVE
jgi:peptide deformylase